MSELTNDEKSEIYESIAEGAGKGGAAGITLIVWISLMALKLHDNLDARTATLATVPPIIGLMILGALWYYYSKHKEFTAMNEAYQEFNPDSDKEEGAVNGKKNLDSSQLVALTGSINGGTWL